MKATVITKQGSYVIGSGEHLRNGDIVRIEEKSILISERYVNCIRMKSGGVRWDGGKIVPVEESERYEIAELEFLGVEI